MKQKIYIDCQFFQTPVWDRGMGKYTLSLLKHCSKELGSKKVELIFSDNLAMDKKMLVEVMNTLPNSKITSLDLVTTEKISYREAAKLNKQRLEESIGSSPDSQNVFLIPCLFQEPTASVYPGNTTRMMIYYDAIPFLYYQKYRGAINYDNYLQRHKTLLESDTILTISETVKDDMAIYLGVEAINRRIISIDGAAVEGSGELQKPYQEVPDDYILLTTSDDIRKNNLNAVLALKQLNKITKKDLKMVITSSFRKAHREELEKLSGNLVFTGNVDVGELNWLYKNAKAILAASEYEGLGLPILEATRFDKPIACSNIAVFREISNQAFYFFNPLDVEEITLMLRDAVDGKDWGEKRSHYESINQKYTWERSSRLLMHEIDAGLANPDRKSEIAKPKIAILCPAPSGYSAVGRVVQESHDALSKYFDIDYYFENRKSRIVSIRPNYIKHVTNSYEVSDFNAARYADYDAVIYHIGNSEYHFTTICNALYLPGLVIIHDTQLTECFGEMAKLGYISPERLEVEIKLNQLMNAERSVFIGSILNNQIGAVCHSDYALEAMSKINIKDVLLKRNALAIPTPLQSPRVVRKKRVQVGLAGVLSGKRKGIDIIKDLARDPEISANAAFYVFGFNLLDPQDIEELKSFDNITVKTDLSDLAYQTQLANLDIMINYRSEYRGESSSSVLEAMRYGCTVIVNGSAGWFAELPDAVVAKANSPAQLEKVLRELILSPGKRAKIGEAARTYVPKHHSPALYSQSLKELYNKTTNSRSINAQRRQIIKEAGSLDQVASKVGELDER